MIPLGTAIDEEAVARMQETSCRCRVFRDDFYTSPRTDAVPYHGSGMALEIFSQLLLMHVVHSDAFS